MAPKREISRSGNGFVDAESMDAGFRDAVVWRVLGSGLVGSGLVGSGVVGSGVVGFRGGGVLVFGGSCLLGLIYK